MALMKAPYLTRVSVFTSHPGVTAEYQEQFTITGRNTRWLIAADHYRELTGNEIRDFTFTCAPDQAITGTIVKIENHGNDHTGYIHTATYDPVTELSTCTISLSPEP